MVTANQQITSVPGNLWHVHVNGALDSQWPSRRLARLQKGRLRGYGIESVTVSTSSVTVGTAVVDTHS